jgi:hypothetical protein
VGEHLGLVWMMALMEFPAVGSEAGGHHWYMLEITPAV